MLDQGLRRKPIRASDRTDLHHVYSGRPDRRQVVFRGAELPIVSEHFDRELDHRTRERYAIGRRPETGTTELVDAQGGTFNRKASIHMGLSRRILASCGGQHLTDDGLGHERLLNARARQKP